jgi:glycosyltransferase involved in cell wall biosynthesis
MDQMIYLSVIIPTRNRASYLSGLLESLTTQTYRSDFFEVIVIDNGSTDDTKKIVTLFNQRINNLRYYYEETPGLHVGRNLGLQVSNGEYLAYLDDDVIVKPSWAEAIPARFESDKNIALLGGPCLPHWEITPPDWINNFVIAENKDWKLSQLSLIDLGPIPKFISALDVYGCNFSIRKDVLFELGGFHPDGLPNEFIKYRGDGETHISKLIDSGHRMAFYEPLASVTHYIPASRLKKEYFIWIAKREAISHAYYLFRDGWRFGKIKMIGKTILIWADFSRALFDAFRRFILKRSSDNFTLIDYYFVAKWHIAIHFSRILLTSKLRKWVLQPTYFKKDPCLYWQE